MKPALALAAAAASVSFAAAVGIGGTAHLEQALATAILQGAFVGALLWIVGALMADHPQVMIFAQVMLFLLLYALSYALLDANALIYPSSCITNTLSLTYRVVSGNL